ncbi:hypothetical protein [Stenotrophomonas nitritireducens]|uniref:hypothetical protein n=1 Tax=Stenotrophomonas nitritireducens TaxID=83617 RepID=UPI003D951954
MTIEVEATAVGATRAQFPELPVPSLGDAAQVFAEPPRYDETFDGGGPQLKLTRRYSIVPQQPGTLAVPGLRMRWWDVRSGRGQDRRAARPEPAGGAGPRRRGAAAAGAGCRRRPPRRCRRPPMARHRAAGRSRRAGPPVALLAAGFALLWLLWLATLVWALTRPRAARRGPATAEHGARPRAVAGATHSLADLRRALDAGDLDDDVEQALRCAAWPVPRSPTWTNWPRARLDSATQRQALDTLRARALGRRQRHRGTGRAAGRVRRRARMAHGRGDTRGAAATALSRTSEIR